jgi:hypothetical protein
MTDNRRLRLRYARHRRAVPYRRCGLGAGFHKAREFIDDAGYRGTIEVYTPDFGVNPDPGALRAQRISGAGLGIRFGRSNNLSPRRPYAVAVEAGGLQQSGDAWGHFSLSHIF